MSINRVFSNVDLYAHLRVDADPHGRPVGRHPPPNSEGSNVAGRHSGQGSMLSLDVGDRPRQRRWEEKDGGMVIPFERPQTGLSDAGSDDAGRAEEIPLTLEVGGIRRDPLLDQTARLYTRSGRGVASRSDMVGTLLDAVA